MSTRGKYIDYLGASGKALKYYRPKAASETAFPAPCFMIGRKKLTSIPAAANALAKLLADRVQITLKHAEDVESADNKHNRYKPEGRARWTRLYTRAKPIAKRYVMKYLK